MRMTQDKMSNVALWLYLHAKWKCHWAPQSTALTKYFIEASHCRDTPLDAPTFTGGKKPLYTKFKNLMLVSFLSCKTTLQYLFSQISMGAAAFPQTKTWGIENAEGFHIAWPKPSQSGPEARREPFPSPDVSNKGQPKTQPWWDPASPLSSGSINHRARLLQWELLLLPHKSNPAERSKPSAEPDGCTWGRPCTCSPCRQPPCSSCSSGDARKIIYFCNLPKFVLSVGTGRLPKGRKLHVPVNKVKACSASTEGCTGPTNICTSPEISFPHMFPAGKILKEGIGTGSHSTPLPMALLRSLWQILQVMWDWENSGIFKNIHIPNSLGWCLHHTAWKSVPHALRKELWQCGMWKTN